MALREHLFDRRAPADPHFRWRGGEVSRLEALSDGVFAITLTLLVVTLDVPQTFHELWLTIRDLPIFLVSFLMLMMAWHYHYLFFRRYGLEDFLTASLNSAFLFLVIFYAYPLKFLATFLWRRILGEGAGAMFEVPAGAGWTASAHDQSVAMMYFYGLGVIGVFGVLALMVARAYRLREVLDLDDVERLMTRASIVAHVFTVAVALVSLAALAVLDSPAVSGMTYFLMGPVQGGWGAYIGAKVERMERRADGGDAG